MDKLFSIIDSLSAGERLTEEQFEYLVSHRSDEGARLLQERAAAVRDEIYGRDIFVRGLIEFSNVCKNDCYYCGIRKSNPNLQRYRLSEAQIMYCVRSGYDLGFRTFVLQSGEDGHFTDEVLCGIIRQIKTEYPDCAVTLSLGERSYESYAALKDAGADRYLLRHETATKEHYEKLHPSDMSFEHRMQCLRDLRELGYAVGAGFMVGAPYQTPGDLSVFTGPLYEGIDAYHTKYVLYDDYYKFEEFQEKIWLRNFFCYSIFKVSPLFVQATVYNEGRYNQPEDTSNYETGFTIPQVGFSESSSGGVDRDFMAAYEVLNKLHEITEISTEAGNTFMYIDNDTTHDAMLLQDIGIHPDAVSLSFLDLYLPVRTNQVQILFRDIVPLQILFIQHKAITFLTGILPDVVRYKIQGFFFARTLNDFSEASSSY